MKKILITGGAGLRIFVEWVKNQKIERDLYNFSVEELKNKGLIR